MKPLSDRIFKTAQSWWTRKKSKSTIFRHSGESRNPVYSITCEGSGLRFSPEWRLFTNASILPLLKSPNSTVNSLIRPSKNTTALLITANSWRLLSVICHGQPIDKNYSFRKLYEKRHNRHCLAYPVTNLAPFTYNCSKSFQEKIEYYRLESSQMRYQPFEEIVGQGDGIWAVLFIHS